VKQALGYVFVIFEHKLDHRTLKKLHKKHQFSIEYSVFIKNISLFQIYSNIYSIKASSLYNCVDTTLIDEKKQDFICQKDWDGGHVTIRKNKKTHEKTYICGSTGLVFMNRFKQIYRADLLDINYSDQNILKDFSLYLRDLKGFLLADRGFSNKAVRIRLNGRQTSAFQASQKLCHPISPYHYKENKKLTLKESQLYKRRWQIETLFQKLKHNYSEQKLHLKEKYNLIVNPIIFLHKHREIISIKSAKKLGTTFFSLTIDIENVEQNCQYQKALQKPENKQKLNSVFLADACGVGSAKPFMLATV
jgi:Transposase DDE domain